MRDVHNRYKSDRPRAKDDFYVTPMELCTKTIKEFLSTRCAGIPRVWLDAGAGTGVWGSSLRCVVEDHLYPDMSLTIIGSEINPDRESRDYDKWFTGDFLNLTKSLVGDVDVVFGNPPFRYAEKFVRHALSLVNDYGYVFFLFRLAFLESKTRANGLFKEFPPEYVQVLAPRPSFFSTRPDGKPTTDTLAYAIFGWEKKKYMHTVIPKISWLRWG